MRGIPVKPAMAFVVGIAFALIVEWLCWRLPRVPVLSERLLVRQCGKIQSGMDESSLTKRLSACDGFYLNLEAKRATLIFQRGEAQCVVRLDEHSRQVVEAHTRKTSSRVQRAGAIFKMRLGVFFWKYRFSFAIGLCAGVFLFLIDNRESHLSRFDVIQIGMSTGNAAQYLQDADGPLCSAGFNRPESDCWFRDGLRGYRIIFDRNDERVIAKYSWRRHPRSILDRLW